MSAHYKGIAGKRNGKMKGVMLHNDAGSKNATKDYYQKWLKNHNAVNGFAHCYCCSDGNLTLENRGNRAWHAGNATANNNYYSIEVCQSIGALKQFEKNEVAAFKKAAQIMCIEAIKPTRSTVRLHREFSATACPHRSWEIHGKSINKVKDYFIKEIKKYLKRKAYLKANQKVVVRWTPSSKGKKYLTKTKAGSGLRLTQRYIDADGYRWMEYKTVVNGKKAYAPYYKLSNPSVKFWTLKWE